MAHELSGFFDGTISSSFWTQLVLQESHNVTSIRHAIIALGAVSKSLDNAPKSHLKVNIIQDIDKKHHEQAVLQHLKAIQALNQYISSSSSPQLRNALITCLLFICFELLLGGVSSSVQQTYGGLKILQSYYIGKSGSRAAAHRRPFTIQPSRSSRSEALSKALDAQVGSDLISRDRVISSHVEEYLESESSSRPDIEVEPPSPERASSEPAGIIEPSSEGNLLSAGEMGTSVDFRPQIQRAMSMYVPDNHLDVPPSYAPRVSLQPLDQPDLTGLSIEQNLSSGPSSTASSPFSNASPPSGRLTPSSQIPSSSRKRPTSTRTPTPTQPLLQSDVNIEDILVQTFVRLDGQCLFFGMIPSIPPLIWDVNKVHHLPVPVFFQDFHSAHRCWDSLMDRALQFYRRTLFNRAYSPASSDSPASIARQLTSWQKQLSSFETTFQPILDNAVQPDGTVSNSAALAISLYQKCVSIMLASAPRDSEMVFDAFLPDFQYIVRTCALLISSQEDTYLPRNPRFSFDIGVVPPLHVVSTKCRDPITRREAVDLLWSNPRQEGMWDSVLSARMGLWIINSEEDGLLPPQLPIRNSSMPGLWSEDSRSGQFSDPTTPFSAETTGFPGYFKAGKSIVEGQVLGLRGNESASRSRGGVLVHRGGKPLNLEHQTPHRNKGKDKAPTNTAKGWVVPEGNRVQLKAVDFHIPDRHINVRVHKALLRRDGAREERETVIAW
jgi:hypothetical protein